jgi:hypothetical protein
MIGNESPTSRYQLVASITDIEKGLTYYSPKILHKKTGNLNQLLVKDFVHASKRPFFMFKRPAATSCRVWRL